MGHSQGLGKTRHVDVQYLWIQAEVAEGRLAVKKVGTMDRSEGFARTAYFFLGAFGRARLRIAVSVTTRPGISTPTFPHRNLSA